MRIAHHTPVKCSGCFAQKPDSPHVDFESFWEGPLVDESNPRGGHIDWLMLCDECIRIAYELLPEQADRANYLDSRIEALEALLAEERAYNLTLTAALQARPSSFETPHVEEIPKPEVPAEPEEGEASKEANERKKPGRPKKDASAPTVPLTHPQRKPKALA